MNFRKCNKVNHYEEKLIIISETRYHAEEFIKSRGTFSSQYIYCNLGYQ
jgi:hypothetical protein